MEVRCYYQPCVAPDHYYSNYSAVRKEYGTNEPCTLVVYESQTCSVYGEQRVTPMLWKKPLAVGDKFYRKEAPEVDKKELLSRAMFNL